MVHECDFDTASDVEFSGQSPFLLEFCMVDNAGHRCMAYCDHDGTWHCAISNKELFGTVTILE